MNTIKCEFKKLDCFGNMGCNRCKILSEPIKGEQCPFYKTHDELDAERFMAHEHLKEIGRYDLIHYYEYNKQRTW